MMLFKKSKVAWQVSRTLAISSLVVSGGIYAAEVSKDGAIEKDSIERITKAFCNEPRTYGLSLSYSF
jgi:hypothetical protein